MKKDLIAHIATEVPVWKPLVDTARFQSAPAVFIVLTGLLAWLLGELVDAQTIVLVWGAMLSVCFLIFDDVFCSGMIIAAAGCFGYHSIVHLEVRRCDPLL